MLYNSWNRNRFLFGAASGWNDVSRIVIHFSNAGSFCSRLLFFLVPVVCGFVSICNARSFVGLRYDGHVSPRHVFENPG